ncbi:MAG: hypothetical protein R3F17_17465 [Planctomycetota bacterium]
MDNATALKVLVLLITMPAWMPFAKAMWEEMKLAMREDGGLFGPVPNPAKRRRLHAEIAKEPLRQVHILKGHLRSSRRELKQEQAQSGPQTGQRGKRPWGR